MIAPLPHMNGDRRETLLEQIEVAHAAIRIAQKALQETAPNARNYYVINDSAFVQAKREHHARAMHLQVVLDELEGMAEAIHAGQTQFLVKERP